MSDIVLVSMPFGPLFWPSIGLSLLKAGMGERRASTRVHYFTIRFAERIGPAFYDSISAATPALGDLTGEWIFSGALFGPDPTAGPRYANEILTTSAPARRAPGGTRSASKRTIERVLRARELAETFLDGCLEDIVHERPRVVGFTSVFQQHAASLALAQRLKQVLPDVFIVFGGANCEGVMGAETIRQFAFVDAAVSGEAEVLFPEIVNRVLKARPISHLPGVRTRETVALEFARDHFTTAPMSTDLDHLPYPDYSDYFEQFRASRVNRDWQPILLFETSRGCWWGERMHCTFCGLNGQTMAFRSKSAGRAMEELADLEERHPGSHVRVVDNILDLRYFKDFLPALARKPLNLDLYYETKSNLKKEQVRLLGAAGVRTIQPGIESFSDPVLKIMRKGVTGLQNIQVLKWCKQYRIKPEWNILWGFPGEPPHEYERLAALAPLLTHLSPPDHAGRVRLDRFSPNFFDAERLGLVGVTPLAAYRHVYRPLPDAAVANLAYYFDFGYGDGRDVDSYVGPLRRAVARWQRVAVESELLSVEMDEYLLLWDLRPAACRPLTVLRDLDRPLYQACDQVRQVAELVAIAAEHGVEETAEDVMRRLQPLVAAGLVLKEGSRYLSLAIPLGDYSPAPAVVDRLHRLAASLGRSSSGTSIIPLTVPGYTSRCRIRPGERRPRIPRRAPRGRRLQLGLSQFSINHHGELVLRESRPSTAERT